MDCFLIPEIIQSICRIMRHSAQYYEEYKRMIRELSSLAKPVVLKYKLKKEVITTDVFANFLVEQLFTMEELELLNYSGTLSITDESKMKRKLLQNRKWKYLKKLKKIYESIFDEDYNENASADVPDFFHLLKQNKNSPTNDCSIKNAASTQLISTKVVDTALMDFQDQTENNSSRSGKRSCTDVSPEDNDGHKRAASTQDFQSEACTVDNTQSVQTSVEKSDHRIYESACLLFQDAGNAINKINSDCSIENASMQATNMEVGTVLTDLLEQIIHENITENNSSRSGKRSCTDVSPEDNDGHKRAASTQDFQSEAYTVDNTQSVQTSVEKSDHRIYESACLLFQDAGNAINKINSDCSIENTSMQATNMEVGTALMDLQEQIISDDATDNNGSQSNVNLEYTPFVFPYDSECIECHQCYRRGERLWSTRENFKCSMQCFRCSAKFIFDYSNQSNGFVLSGACDLNKTACELKHVFRLVTKYFSDEENKKLATISKDYERMVVIGWAASDLTRRVLALGFNQSKSDAIRLNRLAKFGFVVGAVSSQFEDKNTGNNYSFFEKDFGTYRGLADIVPDFSPDLIFLDYFWLQPSWYLENGGNRYGSEWFKKAGQIVSSFNNSGLKNFILPIDKQATKSLKPNVLILLKRCMKTMRETQLEISLISCERAILCLPFLRSDNIIQHKIDGTNFTKTSAEVIEQYLSPERAFLVVSRDLAVANEFLCCREFDESKNLFDVERIDLSNGKKSDRKVSRTDDGDDDGEDDTDDDDDDDDDGDDDFVPNDKINAELIGHGRNLRNRKAPSDDDCTVISILANKKNRQKEINHDYVLVSSQRSDSITNMSFVATPIKFYMQLFQITEPFFKAGSSQMKNEQIGHQYRRDRLPFESMIYELPFTGPGVKELYDKILKKSIAPYLYRSIEEHLSTEFSDITAEALKRALANSAIVYKAEDYDPSLHELYDKKSILEVQKEIINIQQMDFESLRRRLRAYEAEGNLRATRSRFQKKNMPWSKEEIADIYTSGYSKGGSVDVQGGGSLALSPDGIASLGQWLTNYYNGFLGFKAQDITVSPSTILEIIIFWIGIGYAEEAILLVLLIKKGGFMIRLRIIGIDIHPSVVAAAKNMVEKFDCGDCISLCCLDIMNVCVHDTVLQSCIPHIVYTSAAGGQIFDLKMLYLCIAWKACLLCNLNSAELYKKILKHKPILLVNAWLNDSGSAEPESRDIYLIEYPHLLKTTNDILNFINFELVESLTAEKVRGFTSFQQTIEKVMDYVNTGRPFNEDIDFSLENTQYASFLSSYKIPLADIEAIFIAYRDSTSDKIRNNAKVDLSGKILNSIVNLSVPKIRQYFFVEDLFSPILSSNISDSSFVDLLDIDLSVQDISKLILNSVPLTSEQERYAEILNAYKFDGSKIIASTQLNRLSEACMFRLNTLPASQQTQLNGNWFTSGIICYFIEMLQLEDINNEFAIYDDILISTLLSGNADTTRKAYKTAEEKNINKKKYILAFVNIDNFHWSLVYIDKTNLTVSFFNGKKLNASFAGNLYTEVLIKCLCDKSLESDNAISPDQFKYNSDNYIIQDDGHNCGLLVCLLADYIVHHEVIPNDSLSKENLRMLRIKLSHSIVSSSLNIHEINLS